MTIAATLTSKGQTTIPKEIRDALGMKAGDQMTFTLLPGGAVIMRVKNKSARDMYGRMKAKNSVTVDEMNRWK